MASRVARQWRDTASLVAGPQAMLAGDDGPLDGRLASQMLATPGPSIYGGSDQIQRNIISERVLGLPREADPSRTMPFRELKIGTQAAAGSSHDLHVHRRAGRIPQGSGASWSRSRRRRTSAG